jgi:O-antigen ligase
LRLLASGALLALVVFLPWRQGGADPLGLFVTHTLVFVLLGLAIAARMAEGAVVLKAGWEAAAGLCLLAVSVASFLRVDYLFGSFLSMWNLTVAMLLAGVMMVIGGRAWKATAWAVAIVGAGQAVCVFVMQAPLNLTPSSTFANANQLAAYLTIGLFTALAIGAEAMHAARAGSGARGWMPVAASSALAGLDLAALLRLGARGALASVIVVAALWGLALVPKERGRLRAGLAAALAVVAIAGAVSIAARFSLIDDPYLYDRARIWRAGLAGALDHPVLGMGPGMWQNRGFAYNFPLERETFRYSKTAGSTHSTYLQALVETGAIGLIAVAFLVALLGRRAWSLRGGHADFGPAAAGPAMALLACLMQAAVDMTFDVPAVSLTLIVLVVPLMLPGAVHDAPFFVAIPSGRSPSGRLGILALAVAAVPAYLGGVLVPYAAHRCYEMGLEASRPGAPDARLSNAVRLNPYNPLYLAVRSEFVWRQARALDLPSLAAAHHDLLEAHRLDPGRPEYLNTLGRLHARACFDINADPAARARAEEFFRRGIALGGKDPRPHLELASFLAAEDKGAEAILEIREALGLEPNFLGAHLALARALLDAGRASEAVQALQRLEELRWKLERYVPKNGYEEDLLHLDGPALAEMESRLLGASRRGDD